MKYPTTVRNKIKEVCEEITKENEISLGHKQVEDIINKFFGTVKKVMSRGIHNEPETFVNRIEIPSIGFIQFKNDVIRRIAEKDIKSEVNIDHAYNCYAYIRSKGWVYFKWSKKLGYIYVHEEKEIFYNLKKNTIKGTLNAHIYFSEIIDTPYALHNIPINLDDEFILIYPISVKGFRRYSKEGKLVREYNTLEEAARSCNCKASNLLWAVLRNIKMYPSRMLLFKNEFWTIRDDKYNSSKFLSYSKKITHNFLIDILDKDTNKVIYKNFGTASDIAKYIRSLNKYSSIKTTPILRVLDKNKTMYGFKYKRSI